MAVYVFKEYWFILAASMDQETTSKVLLLAYMKTIKQDHFPLTGKTHFRILDGLRGLAALAVVIFHFMEIAVPDYADNFIAHGYLAVDFFFCLSGFVIAYAYDNRIETIGKIKFFMLRLIRLQPLVVTGAFLGLLSFVFDPFHSLYPSFGFINTVIMFLSSCLLVPYPMVPERYNNLFHFNAPTWSLFWEYIANIFYALVIFKWKNKTLWVLTLIAAGTVCYTAMHYDNLSVGWGAENFVGGAARVFFSFLAGILVFRSKWIIRSPLGFVPISLLLCFVFFIPFVKELNRIIDPLLVIFYFPFLIALGAGARLAPGLEKACNFSGEISYPLYMVHYPFIWVFLSYVEVKKPAMSEMKIIIPVATLLLIAFAYVVMAYLDKPVRAYLTKKLN